MKKIGILNFQHSNDNYGAVIQAAALNHIIKKYSANVEHINFIPEDDCPPPLTFSNRIKRVLSKGFYSIIKKKFLGRKQVIGNANTFESFRQSYIPRTVKCYTNLQELSEIKNDYSAIIVGSDQVWRLAYTAKFAKVYFLSFASKNTKRISYAASFGLDLWEDEKESEVTLSIKKELNKFSEISVREKSGVAICSDIFDVKATHVLDPTLLVDSQFYDNILLEHPSNKSDEIVFYKLDLNNDFIHFTSEIAKHYQCEVQNIYHKYHSGRRFFTDVPKWLSQIKNSRLVITDSFHCVCFSIVFKKQFLCIVNESRGKERLQSLLSDLGLLDRLCFDYSEENTKKVLENEIDYIKVNHRLKQLRDISTSFLNASLS